MFPQESRTPPLHSRQQPRSKDTCSFGSCGVVPKGKRGLTRGALCHTSSINRAIHLHLREPYLFVHAHHTFSSLLCHTSFFVRAVALPSCFVTPLPSFATYVFHLPLPPTSKSFQRFSIQRTGLYERYACIAPSSLGLAA